MAMSFFRTLNFSAVSLRLAIAALLFGLPGNEANAQGQPAILRTINNPAPSIADNFGRNLMVTHNGLILCGAAGSEVESESFSNIGMAYLIDGATGEVKFTLPNPEPESNVGYGAFSWAGDTKVIVSAVAKPDAGTTTGRAYIFNLADGQHTQTLLNPTPEAFDDFGYGLGMLGDIAIVGARGDDGSGPNTGTVYLFDSSNGALLRTIENPETSGESNFGYSVAGIGTDRILVGAPGDDTGATDSGVAYVMNASTGQVIRKIVNPDPLEEAFFGFQVRAYGTDLLIGSPGNNRAFLFDGETGELLHRFVNPDVQEGAFFGSTVSAVGKNIIIGNPLEPVEGKIWIGRAYLFDGKSGALLQTYENPSPEQEDRFGVSVAGLNGNIVISSDQNRVNNIPFAGTIYVFQGPRSTVTTDWNYYH